MDLSISEKKLKPVRNPARIHSPDPFLRAGKSSRGFAKSFPPENSFGKTESALVPPPARILGGQNTKEKCPFLFRRSWSHANPKSKEHFSLVSAEALRGGGGTVHSRSKKVRANAKITPHHKKQPRKSGVVFYC